MTIPRRRTPSPVPLEPTHKRAWRSLWRRCSCGLPAPCVDRRVPPSTPPLPQTPAPSHPRHIADPLLSPFSYVPARHPESNFPGSAASAEDSTPSSDSASPAGTAFPAGTALPIGAVVRGGTTSAINTVEAVGTGPGDPHRSGYLPLPASPRPIAHPRNAPHRAQNHPPAHLGSITHPIRAHPGRDFDQSPSSHRFLQVEQADSIRTSPADPLRTQDTISGPSNTHRSLPVDALGSGDAPQSTDGRRASRPPLPRQPPDDRIEMGQPGGHGWWRAASSHRRADQAGNDTGPTDWSPGSPAWTAPTMLFSQVGRAGGLTPAQAYRARVSPPTQAHPARVSPQAQGYQARVSPPAQDYRADRGRSW